MTDETPAPSEVPLDFWDGWQLVTPHPAPAPRTQEDAARIEARRTFEMWDATNGGRVPARVETWFAGFDEGRAESAEALRAATARAERAERRLSLHHEVKVLAMTLGFTEAEVWGGNCPVCAALASTEEGQG